MLFRPEPGEPVYAQLYRRLRDDILSGALRPDSRLPASRHLAQEAGVSRNTVLQAYEQLGAEGYVEGRRGAGTFVAHDLPDQRPAAAPAQTTEDRAPAFPPAPRLSAYARRAQRPWAPQMQPTAAHIRHDFRYGLPDLSDFPQTIWRRLLARHAVDPGNRSAHYAPTEGLPRLRAAIADYLHRARGTTFQAEDILIVNGSQQALDLIARLLIDPGDGVLIEEPHYLGAREVFAAAGARLIPAPVDDDGLDLAAAPPGDKARLVYVTPSHQFPSGAVMPLSRRLALLEWARAQDAYVIEDDYDSEFRYGGRPVEAVQALDRDSRVIYLGTMSKTLFPALRIGFMALPPGLRAPAVAIKHLADRHTPTLTQAAIADFIAEGHFERYVRRSRTRNAKRREALLSALRRHFGDQVRIQGSNAGLHLMIWFNGLAPARTAEMVARAAEAGVGVYPLDPYFLGAPKEAGLLLGYTSMDERAITDGIGRLARALLPIFGSSAPETVQAAVR